MTQSTHTYNTTHKTHNAIKVNSTRQNTKTQQKNNTQQHFHKTRHNSMRVDDITQYLAILAQVAQGACSEQNLINKIFHHGLDGPQCPLQHISTSLKVCMCLCVCACVCRCVCVGLCVCRVSVVSVWAGVCVLVCL